MAEAFGYTPPKVEARLIVLEQQYRLTCRQGTK